VYKNINIITVKFYVSGYFVYVYIYCTLMIFTMYSQHNLVSASPDHSKDSDSSDIRHQVRDISIDNKLFHKIFGEIDARLDRMDKHMGDMNHNLNKLDHKFDALSEQLAFLIARSEPGQTPLAYRPPGQVKQSQVSPPPGFNNSQYTGRGFEPLPKEVEYSSSTHNESVYPGQTSPKSLTGTCTLPPPLGFEPLPKVVEYPSSTQSDTSPKYVTTRFESYASNCHEIDKVTDEQQGFEPRSDDLQDEIDDDLAFIDSICPINDIR
jgi:hypothetical protein